MVDKVKNSIVRWAGFLYIGVVVAMVCVLVRVFQLKLVDQEEWKRKSASITEKEEEGVRGDIISSDGRLLATSVPTYKLTWDFRVKPLHKNNLFEKNVDSLAACMSQLFGDSSAQWYAQQFRKGFKENMGSFVVKSEVSYREKETVCSFPLFKLGRNTSGLIVDEIRRRRYPHNELAKRCIGYARDGGQQVGLELAYNSQLAGTKARVRKQKMAGVEMYSSNGDEADKGPKDGSDVIVTLDVAIQDVAERTLLQYVDSSRAEWGTAIVMEVETGKIRAMANLTRDPKTGKCSEDYNYAIGTRVPPGSTFKLASVMAALEKSGMNIDDCIDMPGKYYRFQGNAKPIEDDDSHIMTGPTPIRKIFELSSNVGVATLVRQVYKSNNDEVEFTQRLAKMHFDRVTGIVIEGEGSPLFKQPGDKTWWNGSLEKMSIGYEAEYTPLQMLTFYNAVANNGKMVRPLMLEAVKKHGIITEEGEPSEIIWSICDQATLAKVQELLEGVCERGTAKGINNKFFKIAGKTGTAQILEKDKIVGHSASFAGYFPADRPKYSCIVVVYKPHNPHMIYGSAVAVPVFKEIANMLCARDRDLHTQRNFDLVSFNDRKQIPTAKNGDKEILDRVFSDLNVQVKTTEQAQQCHYVSTTKDGDAVKLDQVPVLKAKVPNVVGMGLREAMYLLKKQNLRVTAVGRGVVKKQSLMPYSNVKLGAKITIELAIN